MSREGGEYESLYAMVRIAASTILVCSDGFNRHSAILENFRKSGPLPRASGHFIRGDRRLDFLDLDYRIFSLAGSTNRAQEERRLSNRMSEESCRKFRCFRRGLRGVSQSGRQSDRWLGF